MPKVPGLLDYVLPYLLYGMKLSPIASLIELVETFAFLLLKIDFTKRACGKMLRA